ncbi:TerB family tellurite resistance protein [Geminicoccaceae bacterium 1502E]|nr:TerB family tellurite resistance protein [Geminicoccaceae bacterium 1502E]
MQRLLDLIFPQRRQESPPVAPEQLAAAALMVEAARLDGRFEPHERERIAMLLEQRFGLAPDLAASLLDEAERAADESVDWHGFTSALKERLDHDGRIAVMEMLWEIAYADGELAALEDSLLRRVAGLLYVSGKESAQARYRALERLGLAAG